MITEYRPPRSCGLDQGSPRRHDRLVKVGPTAVDSGRRLRPAARCSTPQQPTGRGAIGPQDTVIQGAEEYSGHA